MYAQDCEEETVELHTQHRNLTPSTMFHFWCPAPVQVRTDISCKAYRETHSQYSMSGSSWTRKVASMIYKLQAITVFAYSSHAAKDIAAICQDLMRVSLWMGFAAWGVGGVQVEVGGAHTVVDKRRLARRMIAQEEHHRAGRDVLRLGKGAKHPLVDWQES
jgi:hypothetical protein